MGKSSAHEARIEFVHDGAAGEGAEGRGFGGVCGRVWVEIVMAREVSRGMGYGKEGKVVRQ